MTRGRSGRTEVGAGVGGEKLSEGQASWESEELIKVGVVNAAAFVYGQHQFDAKEVPWGTLTVEGYMGIIHSLLVAVANRPSSSLALTAELADCAAAELELSLLLLVLLLLLLL